MSVKSFLIVCFSAIFLLTGCYINSNHMLKTDKNYKFDVPPDNVSEKYFISKNDIIEFRLFSNGGFRAVDYASGIEGGNGNGVSMGRFQMSYYVEADGKVRLPILGKVHVQDSTIRAAEFLLEQLYSEYYVDPFVQITVTNKRVIVFPGTGSDAKVIPLVNNNTTLMEAIAQAGGITDRGKAARIKVFRREGNERKVYLIDLSTIEGLKYADMTVLANDYIYIEPVPQYAREVVAQIAPYISLLTSAVLIYTVFQRVN